MPNSNNNIIPDDLISTINDFKKSKNGSMINIHGKEYATVAHRIAVFRRNLGAKAKIETEVTVPETPMMGKFLDSSFKSNQHISISHACILSLCLSLCSEHIVALVKV